MKKFIGLRETSCFKKQFDQVFLRKLRAGLTLAAILVFVLMLMPACLPSGSQQRQDAASVRGQGSGQDRRGIVRNTSTSGKGRRIALIIGNGEYRNGDFKSLRNPAHDAEDMASALQACGFKVIKKINVGLAQMEESVVRFSDEIKKGPKSVGLLFFAGHGLQINGENYLVPVDAEVRRQFDVKHKCLSASYILDAMRDAGNPMNIIILDACRENPFRSAFRGAGRGGLAGMSAPSGSFVAFSTQPNSFAADGFGRNGLFTSSLLKNMRTPGLRLTDVFINTRNEVVAASGGEQEPWVNQSISAPFYFIPGAASSGASVSSSSTAPVPPPSAPSPSAPVAPPSVARIDFGDLKQEAEAKDKWRKWQQEMEKAFKEAERLGRDSRLSPGNKAKAWERVLNAYFDDNPYSSADDSLRRKAKSRITHWEGLELEAERKRLAAERSSMEADQKRQEELAAERQRLEKERRRLKEEKQRLAQEASGRPAGKSFTNSIRQKFVLIPAGSFLMGSSLSPGEVEKKYGGKSKWFKVEHPLHKVTISKPLYVMTTEVTVSQWRKYVYATGYKSTAEQEGTCRCLDVSAGKWKPEKERSWSDPVYKVKDDYPVTCISWDDAQAFIRWLNNTEGTDRYRLPTEAEWEYAARAGSDTVFPWGDSENHACRYANVSDVEWGWNKPFNCKDGFEYCSPVGSLSSNQFGLYDMIGNAWEWCQDWYGDYSSGSVADPHGPSSGSYRVIRGGSWGANARYCRSAYRFWEGPDFRSAGLGFRLVANY